VTAGPPGPGPLPDRFAELLGITVTRQGPGRTTAELRTGPPHANPHGTVHGAVFYAVAGAAVAAAANDATSSGIITSVLVEYLRPVQVGDLLRAVVEPAATTEREEVFVARLVRRQAAAIDPPRRASVPDGADARGPRDPTADESADELVAWARARGTRRPRVTPQ
jgi:acyl-CoA thioesterase